MSQQKNVLFIVLNLNGWQETLLCMPSILSQTYQSFHIMLIDNGSTDDSITRLGLYAKHERVTFISEPVNTGFAGGVNIGIRYAIEKGYTHVVLLNNDATISEMWLERLMASMTKTRASVVTGLLLDKSGKKIESTADSCSIWMLPFPRQRGEAANHALESGYVFGGTAGASLYKTSLFTDVGLFDESFFAYFEDTDINFRAQLAGHKTYYERSAIAYHDHNTTSKKMPGFTVYQTFKNLPMLFWKNTPVSMLLTVGIRFWVAYGLMYLRAIIRGQFIIATKGLLKSLVFLPQTTRLRRHIQLNRKVTVEYIRSQLYPSLPPNNRRHLRRVFQY